MSTKLSFELRTCLSQYAYDKFAHAYLDIYFAPPEEIHRWSDAFTIAFQSHKMADDANETERAWRKRSVIQPVDRAEGDVYQRWYAPKTEIVFGGSFGGISTEQMEQRLKLMKRLLKTIGEYNYGFRYPDDPLPQLVAALKKLGATEVHQHKTADETKFLAVTPLQSALWQVEV